MLHFLYHQLGYQGEFIYRTNPCNADYNARAGDVGVVWEVRQAGYPVIDIYNMSICRGGEFYYDSIHFNLPFLSSPNGERPSLGELTSQVVQSVLNGICNPLVLDSGVATFPPSSSSSSRGKTDRGTDPNSRMEAVNPFWTDDQERGSSIDKRHTKRKKK
jgi:hypothetical protein